MLRRTTAGQIAAIVLAVLAMISLGQTVARNSSYDQLDLLVDVRHELVDNYVEAPDQKELVESAVRGMISSLNDPYTIFLNEEDLAPFEKQVQGRFSGIGAEIDVSEDYMQIVSPLEDSPAWKAGVMAGDTLLEIDGESTKGLTMRDAIEKLTGEPGTTVVLTVRHRTGEEEKLTVTRDVINVPTIRGFRKLADNHYDMMLDPINKIGYIRITQFTDHTADDMKLKLDQLQQQGVKALILDVRFNPGGLLQAATAVSDLFLPPGDRIVSIKGRSTPEQVYDAKDEPTLPLDVPVVILANEGSASAAEILTGALSENHRALFVGTRTFGKGSVQTIRQLLDGHAAIKLTSAYYYLPSGRCVHRKGEDATLWGVDPSADCYVPMTLDEIKQMAEPRHAGAIDSKLTEAADGVSSQWIEQTLNDRQLARAYDAALGKLNTGQWPKVGRSDVDELVKERKRRVLLAQKERIQEALDQLDKQLTAIDKGETLEGSHVVTEKLQEAVEAGKDINPDAGTIDKEGSTLPPAGK